MALVRPSPLCAPYAPRLAVPLGAFAALGAAWLTGCDTDDLVEIPDCPVGEVRDEAGRCVLDCEEGYEPNPAGTACVVSCAVGYEPSASGDACVLACDAGYEPDPAGESCIKICAPGYVPWGDTCLLDCGDEEIEVDGACVAYGAIAGRICNQALGIWSEGSQVYIELGNDTRLETTTDGEGYYDLERVPPGDYYLFIRGPGTYAFEIAVRVQPGATAAAGFDDCVPPPGHLLGRVCDPVLGLWIPGATITLDDAAGTTQMSDPNGGFAFNSIPAGDYVLTMTWTDFGGGTATAGATVRAGEVTDIDPGECEAHGGSISGRICGGDGYWLSNARVSVDVDGRTLQTTTDGQGEFTLAGLPPGTHTIHIERGSFTMDVEVEVLDGTPTVLPEPVCVPPTARIAVVTGIYDDVGQVLTDLGYSIRHRYTSPTPVVVDPAGHADIIDGFGPGGRHGDPGHDPDFGDTLFWLNGFLMDPVWMSEYDIIFFNCGLDDEPLLTGTASSQALQNLRDFVQAGGSIYVSDWASELARQAFPGRLAFHPHRLPDGPSRIGLSDAALVATVDDSGLQAALGKSQVEVNLNLDAWVVLEPAAVQAPDIRVLLRATIERCETAPVPPFGLPHPCGAAVPQTNTPLTARFEFGAGRVLFTSVHNEANVTADLEAILNYIVFDL